MHGCVSAVLRFDTKAHSRIVGFVEKLPMTLPLVTADERARLLAHGAALAAGQRLDPLPVVCLFTPDAHVTWLLVVARSCGWRHGLRPDRPRYRDACACDGQAVRLGRHRRPAQAAGATGSVFPGGASVIGIRPAGAGERRDHGLMKTSAARPAGTHRDYFNLGQDREGLNPHSCTEVVRSC